MLLEGAIKHALPSEANLLRVSRVHWHEYIGDPTLADAILDRLIHSAHKIHLEGESMRKRAANNKIDKPAKPTSVP